jgi:hypothetical protein
VDIATILRGVKTLDAALARLASARPRWRVVEMIPQDEFSHDVVIRSDGDAWAALEVT